MSDPHATGSRAATDVVAQMIRAYEGKGIAAGVFAEAIIDALDKAGYEVATRGGRCTCRVACGDTPEDEGGVCKGLPGCAF